MFRPFCQNKNFKKSQALGFSQPKPRNQVPPKMQVHNFIHRLIISPIFKFLALEVLEFPYTYKKSF